MRRRSSLIFALAVCALAAHALAQTEEDEELLLAEHRQNTGHTTTYHSTLNEYGANPTRHVTTRYHAYPATHQTVQGPVYTRTY